MSKKKQSVRKNSPKKKKSKKPQKRTGILKLVSNRYSVSFFIILLLAFASYLVYLNIKITDKMSGRIWSLPSHVYARPLELYQGKSISIKQFKTELKQTGYIQVSNRPTKEGQYRILNNSHFELISRDFAYWDGLQKSQGIRLSIYNDQISALHKLYSDESLALFRMEPVRIAGIYPSTKQDRQLIKLDEVPDDLVLALLAVEDRRFYQHWGLDPRSIIRAMLANIMAGGTVQGGSTLTQQLVKNLFLSPERTLTRKINEALMALLLEINYDKSVILETYINEVYLGQNGAQQIHGFELASQYYFASSLKKLRRDQMAMLVGLVKGPSWYAPRRHEKRAKERRNQVLKLMLEQGALSQAQLNKYVALNLDLANKPRFSANKFPALIDLVKRQLKRDYDDSDLKSSGLKIFTSIDPLIQAKAESSVSRVIKQLEKDNKSVSNLQTSLIVASSQQGEVQAMVSDRKPDYPGFNRSLDAVRQIGSLIKPAIYLTALQQPEKYTLASSLDDSPLHIKTSKDKIWSPQNYDKKFTGDILLIDALIKSRNVPTVRLGLDVGLSDISDTLHNLGVNRKIPAYPSMTLGAFSLSPFEVANMYQTYAANGFNVPLKVIREVLNKDALPLKRYPLKSKKAIDERAVFLVNHALHEVTQSGTAKSLANTLQPSVAGKTGTTDDLRDSWFAGFSDDKLAVVWIGRDDNGSTGLTGSSGALRIWADLFSHLDTQSLTLSPPEGINNQWIDGISGGLSNKNCLGAVELPFIQGSEPTEKAECKSAGFIEQIKRFFN
ncbi:MAG: penicillin-binding protein 1B [endosymbiont of Galathealinum brachiosum]|uniref:Penicillin-binding protein 1B n=1 Tax=endosymbiont of Galathealinum brachiosum TaxID=2200906 RepID=A0A370DH74_9GAMM|nr:MAG: penicillin-binding protein 1B [endosymbiont of Galathealinum brachiosum]